MIDSEWGPRFSRATPEAMVLGYKTGWFVWPVFSKNRAQISPGIPMGTTAWWNPVERCIRKLELDFPDRVAQYARNRFARITFDKCFHGVVEGCRGAQERSEDTWMTEEVCTAYFELYKQGVAHSVEVWNCSNNLAGGILGVAVNGLFAADTAFHYETHASKVAMVHLVERLRSRGFQLLDLQVKSVNAEFNYRAEAITRTQYLHLLEHAIRANPNF